MMKGWRGEERSRDVFIFRITCHVGTSRQNYTIQLSGVVHLSVLYVLVKIKNMLNKDPIIVQKGGCKQEPGWWRVRRTSPECCELALAE